MISLPNYLKIKDNYCICYYGPNHEYLIQLKNIRLKLESQFVGLNIYIACADNLLYLLKDEDKVLSKTELLHNKSNFAYVNELKENLMKHTFEELLKSSYII